MSKNEVVIWRDVGISAWIDQIPGDFEVILYDNGAESALKSDRIDRLIMLKCSGFSAMIHFLLNKSTFEDGHTIFVPINPLPFSPDFIKLLENHTSWVDLQPLSWHAASSASQPPSEILSREVSEYVRGLRVRSELFSLYTWRALQFYEIIALGDHYRDLHAVPERINIALDFFRRCEWNTLIDEASRHSVGKFAYGGLCGVRQNLLVKIRRQSLELAQAAADGHSIYQNILERLWLHICGEHFLLQEKPYNQLNSQYNLSIPRFLPPSVRKKPTLNVIR